MARDFWLTCFATFNFTYIISFAGVPQGAFESLPSSGVRFMIFPRILLCSSILLFLRVLLCSELTFTVPAVCLFCASLTRSFAATTTLPAFLS
jgi:hypothetical protein